MNHIIVQQYTVGPVSTNCYLCMNQQTNEIIIVDPGEEAKMLETQIKKLGGKPVAILLTHGHFDHATVAEELQKVYGIHIYAHETEQETLENPQINLSGMVGDRMTFHADCYVSDDTVLDIAGLKIQVLHTPGHTIGGVCYYLQDEKILFSGDTLFRESVGRTDFPKGSASTLIRGIEEKLMPLPDDVVVYPGHNDTTTIGHERAYNPYL